MKKMVSLLAILVASYAIVQYFIIGVDHAGLVQMKLMLSELNQLWYIMLFIHIIFGGIALVIGPFSLSTNYREKNITRHKILGKIYMIGILLGGVSGLYLAFYATGGLLGKIGFSLLSILWLITAYQALRRVKKKKIQAHQKWMIRNYSLTFAAVTLRIWLGLFIWIFGPENFETSYAIIAWLCWVPNILLAELFINQNFQKFRNKNKKSVENTSV